MKIKIDKLLVNIAILYLLIPTFIFLATWIKPYIWMPSIIILSLNYWKTYKKTTYKDININKSVCLFIIISMIISIVWVFISGIGGFGFQNSDLNFRNAIFRDLIDKDWPVTYNYEDGMKGMLVYYIGFWLPAALVGKICGWEIANIFLMIWAILGVLITIGLICRTINKITYVVPIILVFFSGLDIIGYVFKNGGFILSEHIEWFAKYFQFSANTTQLFWVFNQSIPVWILTLLIVNIKENDNIVFIFSLGLLFCPLPLLGLFPILIYKLIINNEFKSISCLKEEGKLLHKIILNIKKSFTYSNIIMPIILLIIFVLYYTSNLGSTEGFNGIIYKVYNNKKLDIIISLFVFLFLEIGIYVLLINKELRKEILFIISLVLLVLIPNYRFGLYNDFAMRVSITPLLIFMCYIIRSLIVVDNRFEIKFKKVLLCLFLGIGSITAVSEMSRYFINGRFVNDTVKTLYNQNESIAKDIDLYVAKDVKNKKYIKYIFNFNFN